MRRDWRWAVAGAVTALLVAAPFAGRLLPAGDSDIGAAQLLSKIISSQSVAYSGYAQTTSSLALPITGRPFAAVQTLFGSTSQLRVWWRGEQAWRVDSISATGETDLHHDDTGTWSWDYESTTARFAPPEATPAVRLPRTDDLVPANLARRLLSEVPPSTTVRLPGRRVAGHETAGLRVRVHDPRSTIEHIDVWALPANGLPVRVDVYGAGGVALVSTTLLELSVTAPTTTVIRFVPPTSAHLRGTGFGDVVAAVDQLGTGRPPDTLAGLARRRDLDLGAVGVYGRGVTVLAAIPLPSRLADDVVPGLVAASGTADGASGVAVTTGALNLRLSAPQRLGARWLLVGTVTAATLRTAVAQLPPPGDIRFGR